MSTDRPTQPNPPNPPITPDRVPGVDDPLDPRPGPDHPSSVESISPAEKARRDWARDPDDIDDSGRTKDPDDPRSSSL